MVDNMVRFSLGDWGSALLDYILENTWIFVSIAFIYGAIILYSKYIYKNYMPARMTEIINNNPGKSDNELYDIWVEYKRDLPWYILVPTDNEFWVRRLSKSDGNYKFMFNDDEYFKTEKEMLAYLVNKESSTQEQHS